jgi:hexosaminidase
MMRFVHAAELSWNGQAPPLDEFTEKFFVSYYGANARDVRELYLLLNRGAYYYMDTFERKVWHWGDIGKTRLPDLPRGEAIEYSPFWNREYKSMVERSRVQLSEMRRAIEICRANLDGDVGRSYDFELFRTMAELIAHTARTYLTLAELENAIRDAHRQHFLSTAASVAALERAARAIEENLKERDRVFADLVRVWEHSRLPKGLSTPDKTFFHHQDRARHFAARKADISYLIWDEQRLGLEDYLAAFREYMAWYRKTYLR